MANTKEIRKQISSISNTQKITSAMEMVASSKMRKTQDRMEMGRPYADRMLSVIGHLANSNPEYKPLYMTERETNNIGIIVVSSDKGLCGGLNINLFRNRLVFLADENVILSAIIKLSSSTTFKPSSITCDGSLN